MIRSTPAALAASIALAGPPDFSPIQTQPNARARLFVDCIAQATAATSPA